jgi:hypothetical protein
MTTIGFTINQNTIQIFIPFLGAILYNLGIYLIQLPGSGSYDPKKLLRTLLAGAIVGYFEVYHGMNYNDATSAATGITNSAIFTGILDQIIIVLTDLAQGRKVTTSTATSTSAGLGYTPPTVAAQPTIASNPVTIPTSTTPAAGLKYNPTTQSFEAA